MGEVRSTIETPSKSPIPKLRVIEDDIADLIAIKQKDFEREGNAMQARNARSIAKLESALRAVQEAKRELESY